MAKFPKKKPSFLKLLLATTVSSTVFSVEFDDILPLLNKTSAQSTSTKTSLQSAIWNTNSKYNEWFNYNGAEKGTSPIGNPVDEWSNYNGTTSPESWIHNQLAIFGDGSGSKTITVYNTGQLGRVVAAGMDFTNTSGQYVFEGGRIDILLMVQTIRSNLQQILITHQQYMRVDQMLIKKIFMLMLKGQITLHYLMSFYQMVLLCIIRLQRMLSLILMAIMEMA